jgi:hypothetical protein
MENMLICILYTVSVLEMAGLLGWNTGNDIHFTEFHNEKHLRIHKKFEEGWFLPMRERM